jgi:exodeoxyribonuclease VII small subunit
MSKNAKGAKDPTYGEAAARLDEILTKIEEGEVDIDELSGLVEEAAGLVALCRGKIQAAEMKVKTITEQLEREAASEGTDNGGGDTPESIRD